MISNLKKLIRPVIVAIILFALVSPIIPITNSSPVYAASTVVTFYSSSSDGRIYSSAGDWATVRAESSGTVDAAVTKSALAGWYDTSGRISRGFLFFNTSSIPDDAIITSATLYLYPWINYSGDAQDLVVTQGTTSTYPHDPLDIGDYSASNYSGDGGRISSTSWTTGDYETLSLNSTGLSWINISGGTKLVFRSSMDIDNSESVANSEFVIYMSEQDGTDKDPYLSVTYTTFPSVTTDSASDIGSGVATLNGEILDTGVTGNADYRGFVWGKSSQSDPGNTDPSVSDYPGSGVGAYWTESGAFGATSFSHEVTGLESNALYYFRATAHNTVGWSYGPELTFGDYNYSQSLTFTIVGSTSGAVTDYQKRIVVYAGSGTNSGENVYLNYLSESDFSDVCFREDDLTTPLDYWMETGSLVEGVQVTFWVKFSSIPAYPGTATFSILYGNPGASSLSDGDATFPYFDDFLEDPGYSEWTGVYSDGGGSFSVTGGILTVTENNQGTGMDYGIRIKDDYTFTNTGTQVMAARVNPSVSTGDQYGLYFNTTVSKSYYLIKWFGSQDWTVDGPVQNFDQMYVGGDYQIVSTVLDYTYITGSLPIILALDDDGYQTAESKYDWVFIRKYIAPEPSWGTWSSAGGTPEVISVGTLGTTSTGSTLLGNLVSVGDSTVTQTGVEWGGGYEPFTVVVLPDTQFYSELYPDLFRQQTQWIVDNVDTLNIKFVIQVGDIVNVSSSTDQWTNADSAMDILDNADIPNFPVIATHDYDTTSTRDSTSFDTWFPVTRYSSEDWYGGCYGNSSSNMWGTFTVDSQEYLVIGLEFGPRDAVVAWANGIISAHPGAMVILFTHSYLNGDSTLSGTGDYAWAGAYGLADYNSGEDLWTNLVSLHSNIVLVACGHVEPSAYRTDYVSSQPISQTLQNFQGETLGGGGYLRYYEFTPNTNQITAITYSPYYNQYRTESANYFILPFRGSGLGYGGYPRSKVTSGSFSTGSFQEILSSLTPDREYYFRAKAYNTQGWGYGEELSFSTLSVSLPTVTTSTQTGITSSGATLQGIITSLGIYSPVYVAFEYGTSTSYGSTTVQQTFTTASAYSQSVTGLTPGQTYHYRAKLVYGSGLVAYGSDVAFVTGAVTPETPTSFTAQGTGTSIVLNWVKGSYSTNTMIRYSTTSTPSSIAEGTQAYFDSASTYTLSGLEEGTTYYFSAWGEKDGVYSSSKISTSAQPTIGALVDPDVLTINDVKIFKDYSQSGDQLYVISYKIVYNDGNPTVESEDYFNLDLLDGSFLIARIKVPNWGYYPTSIYLSPISVPEWGLDYTVTLSGTESKWTTPPTTSYGITSGDWMGSDLDNLDSWVIRNAKSLENYYGVDLTVYTTEGTTRLNTAGGEIYRDAIPGISIIRPDIFSVGVITIDPDSVDPEAMSQQGQEDVKNSFGEETMAKFASLGSYVGLSGNAVAGVFWFAILILVAGIAGQVVPGSHPIIGLLVCIPIMFIAVQLGCIPMAIMAIIATVLIVLTGMSMWLARS